MSHSQIEELLPWYVNGTLTDAERTEVEDELQTCPACEAAVRELHAIMHGVTDLQARALVPSSSLKERVFARLAKPGPRRTGTPIAWLRRSPQARAALALAASLVVIATAVQTVHQPQSTNASATDAVSVPVANRADHAGGGNADELAPRALNVAAPIARMNGPAAGLQRLPANEPLLLPPPPPPPPAGAARSDASKANVQIARTGSVTVLVDSVERALSSLRAMARDNAGDIVRLDDQLPTDPDVRHSAQADVRVPASRFDTVMDSLPRLGVLESRSINAEDVSDQLVDNSARLRNLRQTEADLLKIMNRSGTLSDVLDVQNQISSVREQIEQLDASLKNLEHRVSYSTISISLQETLHAKPTQSTDQSTLRDAWATAVHAVSAFTLGLIANFFFFVAFLPYLMLVALIAFAAWRIGSKS